MYIHMPVTPCGRKGPLKEESRKNQQGLKMLVFPEKKNSGTIYLLVNLMLRELSQPKVGLFGISERFSCAQGPLSSP